MVLEQDDRTATVALFGLKRDTDILLRAARSRDELLDLVFSGETAAIAGKRQVIRYFLRRCGKETGLRSLPPLTVSPRFVLTRHKDGVLRSILGRLSAYLRTTGVAEEIETAFDRVEKQKGCAFGEAGTCCRICSMGPCRINPKKPEEGRGVCGADVDTIVARNFARMVAGGASAHSDHGRDLAYTLLAAAEGEAPDYKIRDTSKLHEVAGYLGVATEGKSIEDLARDVALASLNEFGKPAGEIIYLNRAPKKRQEVWHKLGIAPRNVDREIVETLHRTHIGNDQDAEHILDHALRCALGDGWGGSMLATDLSDILFGTPAPLLAESNLGVLRDDEVNIIVHGHEPTLSEMIVAAAQDPELIEYAKSKGAKGITLGGICCTANETLMRQGVPLAGNFLQQELALLTGAVEAMVVDIQCIMQGIVKLADQFHTEIITTSRKAKITGATHIEFEAVSYTHLTLPTN